VEVVSFIPHWFIPEREREREREGGRERERPL
jgi:hypothetical protein